MPSAITVGQLLNSAQDSAAAADRCAGSLWKLAVADPDGTYEELRRCVDHLVTLGQVGARTPADASTVATVLCCDALCCAWLAASSVDLTLLQQRRVYCSM
jgi:hypothetical protein